jgi:hypothetical protein
MQDLTMLEATKLESKDEIDRLAAGSLDVRYKELVVPYWLMDYLIEAMGSRVMVSKSVRLK